MSLFKLSRSTVIFSGLVFQATFETSPTIHIQSKLSFSQQELCPLAGVQAAALSPKEFNTAIMIHY